MPPCPFCDSENVIGIHPMILEYLCIDCRKTWIDYFTEWYDHNPEAEEAEEVAENHEEKAPAG